MTFILHTQCLGLYTDILYFVYKLRVQWMGNVIPSDRIDHIKLE